MRCPTLERTNVVIRLTPCRSRDKGRLFWDRLDAAGRHGAVAARVGSLEAAERMAALFRKSGREARILSAKTTAPEQRRTFSWYKAADRPALVVVDKKPLPERNDLRQLYIMNLPHSLADAVRDLDMAGRDGLEADAEVFASARDRNRIYASISGSGAKTLQRRRDALAKVVAWIENDGCCRSFLAAEFTGFSPPPCGNCGWCLGKRPAYLPIEESG